MENNRHDWFVGRRQVAWLTKREGALGLENQRSHFCWSHPGLRDLMPSSVNQNSKVSLILKVFVKIKWDDECGTMSLQQWKALMYLSASIKIIPNYAATHHLLNVIGSSSVPTHSSLLHLWGKLQMTGNKVLLFPLKSKTFGVCLHSWLKVWGNLWILPPFQWPPSAKKPNSGQLYLEWTDRCEHRGKMS